MKFRSTRSIDVHYARSREIAFPDIHARVIPIFHPPAPQDVRVSWDDSRLMNALRRASGYPDVMSMPPLVRAICERYRGEVADFVAFLKAYALTEGWVEDREESDTCWSPLQSLAHEVHRDLLKELAVVSAQARETEREQQAALNNLADHMERVREEVFRYGALPAEVFRYGAPSPSSGLMIEATLADFVNRRMDPPLYTNPDPKE